MQDEQLIRDLIADWQRAVAAGDLTRLLGMMAEDVVFLVAGSPPMRGREAFATAFRTGMQHIRIESSITIQEIQIAGDFAYCMSHLSVIVTPLQGGAPMRRSGYTLTIFRREADGRWFLFRDANLLTPEAASTS